ncbi:MAG: saccharopine dehydrogenase NADP-binding domain-containing protein [Synergistaceae bacterium]|jgi:saccharopine dehydrogenase-like NADP-dependent oxidoreductase|nr:saccharopine dehydrogenase NADP-binding domain-containing protein [Synergistaceae bacterium]
MSMLLGGSGAVGESILRILRARDPQGSWLERVIVSDYDFDRAKEVCANLGGDARFLPERVDAGDRGGITELIRKHGCDFVMDAAAPFLSDNIFDAAYEGGADYASMGTWSVPLKEPAYGYGLENSFSTHMAEYNFKRHADWAKKGRMACICLGIDPGVVDVFARFAAEYLFDEIKEIHVKDGGNLRNPEAGEDDVSFGFNVWTVLDECMNPNVEWSAEKGFFVDRPFAGREIFEMPAGVGTNTLVKVEHEETVLMPRYLRRFGLERVSFKIALDANLINALKVINALGLRSTEPIDVGGVRVVPRDVVAAAAPQPKDIGDEMIGMMLVGVHCIGVKDGKRREIFMYQPFDNRESMRKWGMQAVVAQTGFGAAIGVELIGRGIWKDAGVFAPEYFDPIPYLRIMDEAGFVYRIREMDSEYKDEADKEQMKKYFAEAEARGKKG